MQGVARALRSCQEIIRIETNQQCGMANNVIGTILQRGNNIFSRIWLVYSSSGMPQSGLENMTVSDVLMTKGEEKTGSWLWCRTDDTVYDAVKNMADNNIGSLVVLKSGDHPLIAGIITERDYLRKIIANERCPKYTKVGEVMTGERRLITVSSDTNILHAMQLMTENQIRYVPVIDGKIVGMISIVDAVRAVVEQQTGEVKRLNEFIKGDYY